MTIPHLPGMSFWSAISARTVWGNWLRGSGYVRAMLSLTWVPAPVFLPLLGKATGPRGGSSPSTSPSTCLRPRLLTTLTTARILQRRGGGHPLQTGLLRQGHVFLGFSPFPRQGEGSLRDGPGAQEGRCPLIAHLHSIEEIVELHQEVGGSVHRDRLPDRETMDAPDVRRRPCGDRDRQRAGKVPCRGRKG